MATVWSNRSIMRTWLRVPEWYDEREKDTERERERERERAREITWNGRFFFYHITCNRMPTQKPYFISRTKLPGDGEARRDWRIKVGNSTQMADDKLTTRMNYKLFIIHFLVPTSYQAVARGQKAYAASVQRDGAVRMRNSFVTVVRNKFIILCSPVCVKCVRFCFVFSCRRKCCHVAVMMQHITMLSPKWQQLWPLGVILVVPGDGWMDAWFDVVSGDEKFWTYVIMGQVWFTCKLQLSLLLEVGFCHWHFGLIFKTLGISRISQSLTKSLTIILLFWKFLL